MINILLTPNYQYKDVTTQLIIRMRMALIKDSKLQEQIKDYAPAEYSYKDYV